MNNHSQQTAWSMSGAVGLVIGYSRGETAQLLMGIALLGLAAILQSGLVFPSKVRPMRVKWFGKELGVLTRPGLVFTVPMSQRISERDGK